MRKMHSDNIVTLYLERRFDPTFAYKVLTSAYYFLLWQSKALYKLGNDSYDRFLAPVGGIEDCLEDPCPVSLPLSNVHR